MSTEQQTTDNEKSFDPARKSNGASTVRKPEHTSLGDSSDDKSDPMESVRDAYETGLLHAEDFSQSIGDTVRRNPVLALGAAFGFGVALAVLLTQRD